jgi:leader peptidase (prepilin peptidase)/N-methyltransferase
MTPELLLVTILGLLIGSFLNVCIARWPAGQSVVSPRSRCPQCGGLIAWYDNIPVLSWLALRAKCRACALPIPMVYPLIELATGGIWLWAGWRYGISVEMLRAAMFLTILLGIAMTDAREYIIPDEFSIGGTALGLAFSLPFIGGALPWRAALLGAAAGYALLLGIGYLGRKAFGRDAMGGGDVKMMAMVGAFTGIWGMFLTLMIGAFVGIVVHLVTTPLRRRPAASTTAASPDVESMSADELSAHGYVPFGVSLAIAAALVFGIGAESIIDWYLAQMGLAV